MLTRIAVVTVITIGFLIIALYAVAVLGLKSEPQPGVPGGFIGTAHAQDGVCGNLSVEVQAGQTVQLCPGVTFTALPPVQEQQEFMPGLVTTASLVNTTCLYANSWTLLGAPAVTFYVREHYGMGFYSNIDSWSNTPEMWMAISPVATAAFYSAGPANGFALPTAYYSPGIVAQLGVHADGQLNWAWRLGVVQRHAILSGRVNSPGYASPACPSTWVATEDDILDQSIDLLQSINQWFCWAYFGC